MFCGVVYPMTQFDVYGASSGAASGRQVRPRSLDTANLHAPLVISE